MRCLNCKYDLRKLSEHRCPECGREFDPKDPTTYVSHRDILGGRFTRSLLIVVAGVFVIRAGWGALFGDDKNFGITVFNTTMFTVVIAPMLWLAFIGGYAAWESRRKM